MLQPLLGYHEHHALSAELAGRQKHLDRPLALVFEHVVAAPHAVHHAVHAAVVEMYPSLLRAAVPAAVTAAYSAVAAVVVAWSVPHFALVLHCVLLLALLNLAVVVPCLAVAQTRLRPKPPLAMPLPLHLEQ